MPDANNFSHALLRQYLEVYKNDLPDIWDDEKYKWEAVKHFKTYWDIDDPEFKDMFELAFPQFDILDGVNNFSRETILALVKTYQNDIRSAIYFLYDESADFKLRVVIFNNIINELCLKSKIRQQEVQNIDIVGMLLFLRFPQKYFLYSDLLYTTLLSKLNLSNFNLYKNTGEKILNAYDLFNRINKIICQDKNVIDIAQQLIKSDPDCYQDNNHIILTSDFIFYIHFYYSKWYIKNTSDTPKLFDARQDRHSLALSHCWWLVANPRIWNFADLPTGETQTYTALNENGNKRRVYQNFVDAAVGDRLAGYVSQPQKKLVALCTITAKDGDNIIFRKDEQLADPISYAELKDMPELASMQFFQNSHGSLFSLTEEEAAALMDCIRERNPLPATAGAPPDPYTAEDFCREVYMTPERHVRLRKLLQRQKNIILQGPPGVGKTYAARRLAWSVMECKDDSRITMVQFHQNYAYEDFVMGYRPDGAGFVLREGVFYQACKRAANDADRPHFFIIDEINRGNLSRIFGELLMLLENGHRGESLPLPYNGERFSVPPNLHVIGMMNTADRSLALMDYALRRRFGFCAMPPGFGSAGFAAYLESLGDKPKLRALVEAVKKLNEAISEDASLGRGYCVGHSYFCGMQPEDVTDEKLADIVECDLLPLLEEYWFDDADKRRQWEQVLKGALS